MQNNRRDFLTQAAGGLGSIALAALLADEVKAYPLTPAGRGDNEESFFSPPRRTGAGGVAKRVIQIFCCGGVSHIDTFDYKPELVKRDGQECKKVFDTFFAQPGNLMKSPFSFQQHGKSGRWVSSLLPHTAGRVDDITFLCSMKAKSANHTPATFQMNSGFTLNGFPCLGAWLSYGLGTVNQDLPAFVVLPDPRGLPAANLVPYLLPEVLLSQAQIQLFATPLPLVYAFLSLTL